MSRRHPRRGTGRKHRRSPGQTWVLSLNEQAHTPLAHVGRDVVRAIQVGDPDLGGFQEVGGSRKARRMRRTLARLGYGFWRSRAKGAQECPVTWRRARYKRRRVLAWFLSAKTFVGRRGAGPARLRAKDLPWVLLQDRQTGALVAFGNAHLAPSIYIPVRGRLHAGQVDRVAAWADHVASLHPGIRRIVTMDGNTEDRRLLTPTGLNPYHAAAGTHGPKHLDWVLADGERVKAFTIGDLFTDHDGLVVVLLDT